MTPEEARALEPGTTPGPWEAYDPADVPPGEAWAVRYQGENCNGVKDDDETAPWELVSREGRAACVGNQQITLVARLVPDTHRVIDRPELGPEKEN